MLLIVCLAGAALTCRKWTNPHDPAGNRPPEVPVYVGPDSAATGIDTAAGLVWSACADPDSGDTVRYDVWFGPTDTLTLLSQRQLDTTLGVSGLRHLAHYSWQVLAIDSRGETATGPVWSFRTNTRNYAPTEPYNPTPANGATEVELAQTLSWRGGDPDIGDTVRYDLYFGTTGTLPLLRQDSRESTYVLPRLAPSAVYRWFVVARDRRRDSTRSDTWSFSTRENHAPDAPGNPAPDSGASGLGLRQTLSWSGGDPDPGDTVHYDVYLGSGGTLAPVALNTTDTTCALPRLAYETEYRWLVVARDLFGGQTASDTWSFITMSPVQVAAPDSGARRRFGQWDTILWSGGVGADARSAGRGLRVPNSGVRSPKLGAAARALKEHRRPRVTRRPAVDSTTVYYSVNNGTSWTRVGLAPSPGFHIWQVPGPTSTSQARVQVRQYFAGDTAQGTSALFTVYDSLRPSAIIVDSPVTSSVWEVGSVHNVVWRGGTDGFDSLVVFYSADSGSTWTRQGKTFVAGRYPWTVGAPASTRAMVEVRSYCGASPVVSGRSVRFRTTDPGYADTVIVAVAAGQHPTALCLDSTDNRLYAVNAADSGTAVVIDCNTNQVVATPRVGALPVAAVWNRTNNRVYVANRNSNSVTVIDGATSQVLTTVSVGIGPSALLWHPDRNKVYVANNGDSSVTIISGSTNQVLRTLQVRSGPAALALRPDKGWVFVANSGASCVSVVDGARDSVRATITVGSGPAGLACDDEHKAMYVANQNGNTVTVIDSLNVAGSPISVSLRPWSLAFNPQDNKMYVVCNAASKVAIISTDTRQVLTTLTVGNQPRAIVWATYTDKVYVSNYAGNSVTIIDGASNAILRTMGVGAGPNALLWNGWSRRVYSANYEAGTVSVIARRYDARR